MTRGHFTLRVAKEALKFSAAHFIAYRGFREHLHGHNYAVSVTVEGALGPDGYVIDFGLVKRVAKSVCDELDERMLVPMQSEALRIVDRGDVVEITCEQGECFVLPRTDVVLLPIAHSSAEELARYLCTRVSASLQQQTSAGLTFVEVGVAEAPGQTALFRTEL